MEHGLTHATYELLINDVVCSRSKNMLVTGMLDVLATRGVGFGLSFQLGTGQTPVAFSDVALASPIGSLRAGSMDYHPQPFPPVNERVVSTFDYVVTFPQNDPELINRPITEVGAFLPPSTLCSRALVRDANGDPSSIVLLPSDVLTLRYRLVHDAPYKHKSTIQIGDTTHQVMIASPTRANIGGLSQNGLTQLRTSHPFSAERQIPFPRNFSARVQLDWGVSIAEGWVSDARAQEIFNAPQAFDYTPQPGLWYSGWSHVPPPGFATFFNWRRYFTGDRSVGNNNSPLYRIAPRRPEDRDYGRRVDDAYVVHTRRFILLDSLSEDIVSQAVSGIAAIRAGSTDSLWFYFYPALPPKTKDERLAFEVQWRTYIDNAGAG